MTAMANYEPTHLKRWTMPDNYFGAVWPAYYSSSVGQSRDSSALERSNFACMLKALGGATDTVILVRESHWAVGWVEWIAIHQDDDKALAIADEIAGKLKDYPVVDEDHYSTIEQEDADQTWANCFSPQERIGYIREHRSQFEFGNIADLLGCVRGKYFAGYASELLN
jgi:hypothetical protein